MKKQEDLLKKFYKIIDFDDLMINTVFCLKYNNKNLEEEYSLYLLKSTRKMRIIVNFISLCLVILRFLDSCQGNRFDIDFYFDIFTSIGTLALFIVMHFAVKSFKAVKVLSSIYIIYVCFIYGCSSVIYYFINRKDRIEQEIKNKYTMLILSIIEYLFILEYNFIVGSLLLLVNIATTVSLLVLNLITTKNYCTNNNIIFIAFVVISLVIFMKKSKSVLQRENYLQKYKIDKYFIYCLGLINNMNGLQFTMSKKKLVFENEPFKKYILNSKITNDCLKSLKYSNSKLIVETEVQNENESIENKGKDNHVEIENNKIINSINLKNERNANKLNKDHGIKIYDKLDLEMEISVGNENKNGNGDIKKNTDVNMNMNELIEPKEIFELLEEETFRDKVVNEYLASIKPIRIEKEFDHEMEENLML